MEIRALGKKYNEEKHTSITTFFSDPVKNHEKAG